MFVVISANCMPSNLIVQKSRNMIVVISALCMPTNLKVYNSEDMIVVISAICMPSIYILLAEVPGFAWGIPRTIKKKCAIITQHKRKIGEFPIIAHHERKAIDMPISSFFMTKRFKVFT